MMSIQLLQFATNLLHNTCSTCKELYKTLRRCNSVKISEPEMCWVTFKHFEHSFADKPVLTLQHRRTIHTSLNSAMVQHWTSDLELAGSNPGHSAVRQWLHASHSHVCSPSSIKWYRPKVAALWSWKANRRPRRKIMASYCWVYD